MIIAHLRRDTRSLLACSSTSRSWYIAAVPHLRLTLTARTDHSYSAARKKLEWPKPLRAASKLGLLPFVTRVLINGGNRFHDEFSSKRFHDWTRREFLGLTNVRELTIDALDIPSFMPGIRQYFGQFSPTLRSLTLKEPRGTSRQIVYFIGLFPRLQDLEFHDSWLCARVNPAGDSTPVPPSVPSLRGRLTASGFHGKDLAKTMIDLFGGLRFHHMNLFNVDGTQLLLYGCGNALETLKLQASDLCGEELYPGDVPALANDFTGTHSHRDLDLSRNKSLRELKITAQSLIRVLRDRAPATIPSSFRAVLSTITSPVFSDFVVVYQGGDFYNDVYSGNARAELGDEDTWYHRQFEVFREMYKARDYRLVLWAGYAGDDSVRELKRAVAAEQAKGGLLPQVLMTYNLGAH